MFKNLFKKKPATPQIQVPEVMGLHLGGAFELDALKLRLIEPELIIEGAASTHIIQAVGAVQLDSDSTVLRFYTDDEGYLQVLLSGGTSEAHIADVKLWYFYEVQGVHSDAEWERVLKSEVSAPTAELEGHTFSRVWESTTQHSPPVAMTENTYAPKESGGELEKPSRTDQFAMLYEREAGDGVHEYLLKTAEEKIIDGRVDRCLVISTGFDVQPADIEITG